MKRVNSYGGFQLVVVFFSSNKSIQLPCLWVVSFSVWHITYKTTKWLGCLWGICLFPHFNLRRLRLFVRFVAYFFGGLRLPLFTRLLLLVIFFLGCSKNLACSPLNNQQLSWLQASLAHLAFSIPSKPTLAAQTWSWRAC